MGNPGYIYGLEDPRTGEIRYVGKTVQKLSKRIESHCTPSKLAARTHKNSWLKNLRNEGLKPEAVVIQVLPEADLSTAEIYWISTLRDRGFDLTNGTDGGDGATAGKHQISVAGREKLSRLMSERQRGRPAWNRGVPLPPERKTLAYREQQRQNALKRWRREEK